MTHEQCREDILAHCHAVTGWDWRGIVAVIVVPILAGFVARESARIVREWRAERGR